MYKSICHGDCELGIGIVHEDKNSRTVVRFANDLPENDGFCIVGTVSVK